MTSIIIDDLSPTEMADEIRRVFDAATEEMKSIVKLYSSDPSTANYRILIKTAISTVEACVPIMEVIAFSNLMEEKRRDREWARKIVLLDGQDLDLTKTGKIKLNDRNKSPFLNRFSFGLRLILEHYASDEIDKKFSSHHYGSFLQLIKQRNRFTHPKRSSD